MKAAIFVRNILLDYALYNLPFSKVLKWSTYYYSLAQAKQDIMVVPMNLFWLINEFPVSTVHYYLFCSLISAIVSRLTECKHNRNHMLILTNTVVPTYLVLSKLPQILPNLILKWGYPTMTKILGINYLPWLTRF